MNENLKVQTFNLSMRIQGLGERERKKKGRWISEPSMVVSDTGNVKLDHDFEGSLKN